MASHNECTIKCRLILPLSASGLLRRQAYEISLLKGMPATAP